MAALLRFDKLNVIRSEEYFEQFFGAMRMPDRQRRERARAADEFLDIVLMIFALISVQREYGRVNYQAARDRLRDEYMDAIAGIAGMDSRIFEYVSAFADSVISTTEDQLKKEADAKGTEGTHQKGAGGGEASPALSNGRAAEVAANMALDALGYKDFDEAAKSGKRTKTWLTMMDDRVRGTHMAADGQTVPIDGLFRVGNALLAFPHDSIGALPGSTGAEHLEEIVNCRCFVSYG